MSALDMVTMKTWSELIFPFTVGAAVGFGLSFVFFASRIKFYKQFIERRLAAINPFHFAESEGEESAKSSLGKSFLTRRLKRDKPSKPTQNE